MKSDTIIKCFRKCGIISSESVVVAQIGASEDPFDDVDELCELTALIGDLADSTCSPEECDAGDNSLPVYDDAVTCDDWDNYL